MEEIGKNSNKAKIGLVIDYSKFQNNIKNNKQISEDNNKESNTNKDNNKKLDGNFKRKNLDKFLNVSGILNENESKPLFLDNLNQNNLKESSKNFIESENVPKTDRIFNNNFKDIYIGQNEYQNLLTINCNDLIVNNHNNEKIMKIIENNNFKTTKNRSKKQEYVKFLNENCGTERKKNINEKDNSKKLIPKLIQTKHQSKKNNKNSYVEMIKKNNLFEGKRYKRNNYKQKNDSFNLFNEDNYKYNNSITNLSGISNMAPSAFTTREYSNNTSSFINKTNNNNKIKNALFSNLNKNYEEDLNNKKAKHQKNNSYDKYFNINDLDLFTNKSINIKNNSQNKLKINNNDLLIYNKNKNDKKKKNIYNCNRSLLGNKKLIRNEYENNDKEDEVIFLLDNIKNKYKKKENNYINQQNNMKTEIQILREKLKKLSVNEALYQVEIEKLKRKNDEIRKERINTNIINNNKNLKLNTNNILFNDINTTSIDSNEIAFGQKLDNIIQSNKNNNQKFSLNINNDIIINNNNKLLEIFNLDKNFLVGENMTSGGETIDYIEIFNRYPQLKEFIQILVKKYNNEKEYRIRLEEKTVEIFSNDMKTINTLEKKIKKYEANRPFKINNSLNISSDGGLSDNVTKNSCKSYDKIL